MGRVFTEGESLNILKAIVKAKGKVFGTCPVKGNGTYVRVIGHGNLSQRCLTRWERHGWVSIRRDRTGPWTVVAHAVACG